jgi:hypothetical protein
MNIIVKSAVASALALGATSAFAVGQPTSGSSDLILEVDAITSSGSSAGVYALDTGLSLSSLLPGPYVKGALSSTAFSAPSVTFLASSTLKSFLSANAGDSIQWTVLGGQYNGTNTGPGSTNSEAPGDGIAVFSSKAYTSQNKTAPLSKSFTAFDGYLSGLQQDFATGTFSNLTVGSTKETGSAVEGVGNESKYGLTGTVSDLSVAGSGPVGLFGFTGNGVNATVQSYVLGTANVDAAGDLIISGNAAPVPLPAAVWLFGSGLLGLVGVSRRRKAAV